MNGQAVNNLLRNDATPQTKGILYQFLVALKYCFSLKEGQTLYVEKYGDVAIKDDKIVGEDSAIEVKFYSEGNLTLQHHNFLNTLYNWLQEDFHVDEYSNLVLFTTQTLSKKTDFDEWCQFENDERLKCLKERYLRYVEQHKNSPEESASIQQNLHQMQYVLKNEVKLILVLSKLRIIHSQLDFDSLYGELCDTFLTVIPQKVRKECLNELVGYVVTSICGNTTWVVTYKDFERQLASIRTAYIPQIIDFPHVPYEIVDPNNYSDGEFPFVCKLREIEVSREDMEDSINDFARVAYLASEDYCEAIVPSDLSRFRESLYDEYKTQKRIKRTFVNANISDPEIKNISRRFMWELFSFARVNVPFKPYGSVDSYVYNGMYHHMANESEEVRWLLKG